MYLCVFLGIMQLIMICITLIFEYKKKSISVFLWAMLLIIFGVTHLITCIIGSQIYSNEVLNISSCYTIIFCIIYLIGRIITGKNINNVIIINKENIGNTKNIKYKKYYKKIYKALLVVLSLSIVLRLFLLITSSGGLMNTSWASMRKASISTGGVNYAEIFTVLYFVGASSLIIALMEKKYKDVIFISFLILIEVIISRNRIEILPLFCAFIVIFLNKHQKLNVKTSIIAIFLLIAIIYIVYGLRVFRHYGTISDFINNFTFQDFNQKIKLYIQNDDGELGLKNFFYYFIDNKNNFANFNSGHTYIRMLLFLVPTSLSFGIKPPDFAISMGYAVNPLIKGYSVHPTLFGDCYANFGFYGVIICGLFWALYVGLFDKMTLASKSVYLKLSYISIISFTYIIIGRGSIYNGFVWQMYSLILLNFLNIICRLKYKRE